MTGLRVFGLLALVLTVRTIWAAPSTGPGPGSCDGTDTSWCASLAVKHINQHHRHGYKFNLGNVSVVASNKNVSGCVLALQLNLLETVCHVVNPKPYDECEVRALEKTQVKAECNAILTIANGTAKVSQYACDTAPVPAESVTGVCPDCPTLLPLNHRKGLHAVQLTLNRFHEDNNPTHMWRLLDVGRLYSGYMMSRGMYYITEFAIIETPYERRTKQELLTNIGGPWCSDSARHAVCSSKLFDDDQLSHNCEIYNPRNVSSNSMDCQAPQYHNHRAPVTVTPQPQTPLFVGQEAITGFTTDFTSDLGQTTLSNYDGAKIHPICAFSEED